VIKKLVNELGEKPYTAAGNNKIKKRKKPKGPSTDSLTPEHVNNAISLETQLNYTFTFPLIPHKHSTIIITHSPDKKYQFSPLFHI